MPREGRANDRESGVERKDRANPLGAEVPTLAQSALADGNGRTQLRMLAANVGQAQDTARPPRPTPGPAPSVRVPWIVMRSLSNGVRVAVLENHDFPVVDVSALVVAPRALDPPGKEGVSAFTAQMLAEGTTTQTADDLAGAEADLGTSVSATGFFTIPQYFEPALALMADQLLRPAYPQAALDRIKANAIAHLQRLQQQPDYLAGRIFANAVYGTGHPYARTETRASIAAITREDLVEFHHEFFRPRNVTFIVAGDVTADRAVAARSGSLPPGRGGRDGWITPPAPALAKPTRIICIIGQRRRRV